MDHAAEVQVAAGWLTLARALLAIPGVVGVNRSGLASARGYEFAASVKAQIAGLIREQHGHGG